MRKGCCSMVILYGSLVRVLGQHMGWLPRRPNKSIMGLGFDPDSLLLLSKRSFKGNAFFPFIYSSSSIVRVYYIFRLLNILSKDFLKKRLRKRLILLIEKYKVDDVDEQNPIVCELRRKMKRGLSNGNHLPLYPHPFVLRSRVNYRRKR